MSDNSKLSGPEASASRRRGRSVRPLLKLVPFAMRYKGRVAIAFIALLLAAGATLAVPLAARRMIDHGFSAENVGFIDKYFAMMIVVGMLLAVASACRYYFVTWVGERMVADIRIAVYSHLLGLSMRFFETARTGEILSRLTADTTQIQSAFGSTASVALRNLVLLGGAAVMMVVTSARLSGLVLLAIPVIVLPLVLFGRWVRSLSRTAQDTLADAAAYASESLSAIQTVQTFNHEDRDRSLFSTATETAFQAARLRVWARAVLTASIIFIAVASIVTILWFGSTAVLAGTMTGGALTQFVLYAIFAAGALSSLSQVWGEVQLAAGAAERLAELLETEPEIVAPPRPVALPVPPRGEITFRNVNFAYPGRPDMTALENVSFAVRAGETVALVGPSGAGKSTIFRLLGRFYDIASGTIEIDGVDIARADPHEVRRRLGLVPQDTAIFSASIGDNIRYGDPAATDADVMAAAEAARADSFIDAMDRGMDTLVGERGVMLSGGQRQRIAIARAILRNAPVLLLDEATSALDAESETLVQQALERLMKDRTTLVIAHRLATIRKADRILVFDEGRIVEEGTHASLTRKSGLYSRLADLQFGSEPQEPATPARGNGRASTSTPASA